MGKLTQNEQGTVRYYDKEAGRWGENHNNPKFWGKFFDLFGTLMPVNGTVLEVGTGHGRDAECLVRELCLNYVGTDISEGMLSVARQRLPGLRFELQSVYDLNFPDEDPFDGFWASAVLLHVPKKRINEALQSVRSVLREGGVGFISIKEGEGEKVDDDGRLFSYWLRPEFEKVLRQNGFSVEHFGRMDFPNTKWLLFIVIKQPEES